MRTELRLPAVAGSFYPSDPTRLAAEVDACLDGAPLRSGTLPKAIIVPHAGYVYSGPIAASAYRALVPGRDRIRRVVVLGPAHRVAVRGLALPGVDAFATPLGEVPIDRALSERVSALPHVVVAPRAHAAEHSIEVQLPFLQRTLANFALLPLVVGHATAEQVCEVLRAVWGGPETLIVISSDLSHYLPYADAAATDRESAELILQREPTLTPERACGATAINGLLRAVDGTPLEPEIVDLRNSGDTAGDRERVVGYIAVLFAAREERTAQDDEGRFGRTLVALARTAIEAAVVGRGATALPYDRRTAARLDAAGAVFVTLTRYGRLRGCIGSLEATRPLREDLSANAVAAALQDPRFAPLAPDELLDLKIEVSLLSTPQPIAVQRETDALTQLRPGIDGVVLEYGGRRATYLPQVWEQLATPRDFLAHLKRKAGLPADFWDRSLRISRYTVRHWSEA